MNDLTIVTVTYNSVHVIGALLNSLQSIGAATIVVDNCSQDETVAIAASYTRTQVMQNRNTGYGRAANLGFRLTSTPYVLLMNPDVILSQGAADAMLDLMRTDSDIGIVGARMFNRDAQGHKTYASYLEFDADGRGYTDWISGAVMLIRREALQRVGMFDENIFLFFEETDLCKRFTDAGYKLVVVKRAEAEHVEGRSSPLTPRVLKLKAWHAGWSKAYYFHKHYPRAVYVRKLASKVLSSLMRAMRTLATGNLGRASNHFYESYGALAFCFGAKAFCNDVGRFT